MIASNDYFRLISAIIAAAFITINPDDFNVESVSLELPISVKSNLKEALLPYLKAIELCGYESNSNEKIITHITNLHNISVKYACNTYEYKSTL